MMRVVRPPEENESGVILILFALALVILMGMVSIAIDASYGFVQNRRAQNASDFAAFAAAQELDNSILCNGTNPISIQQVADIIQQVVNDNNASIGTAWSGQFIDPATGKPLGKAFSPSDPASSLSQAPPAGACGVNVTVAPQWSPFYAGVLGVHQLKGYATGTVAPKTTAGRSIGIVALNKVGPHEILGGGTGGFVVSGDIFLNTDVSHQPWTGSAVDPSTGVSWEWDDAVDAKTSSNLYVYGTIHSNNSTFNNQPLWPLDTCFQSSVLGNGNPGSAVPPYQTGAPFTAGTPLPAEQMSCSEYGSSGVTVDYDAIDPTVPQIDDPLVSKNAPLSPLAATTNIACPGMGTTPQLNPAPQIVGLTTELLPGEYTTPVVLTGSVNFQDCSGYPGEAAYAGIYRFDQGLWINPQAATDTVTGTDVVISTEAPYPVAGNVPGSGTGAAFVASGAGNGAPCLPSGTLTSLPSGHGTAAPETSSSVCGGTSPPTNGVIAYGDSSFVPDPTMAGTGDNFSLIVGGVAGATVNLTGPTTGPYRGTDGSPGVVLYQDPGTQANYGFDAEAGDAAAITVTGVVYNASLANYGASAPLDYWDGVGGGIPFYAGGTLQTGFGAGWATGSGPAQSGGSVHLTGTVIVDDFNTDGATDITIVGEPYSLPGSSSLSLIG